MLKSNKFYFLLLMIISFNIVFFINPYRVSAEKKDETNFYCYLCKHTDPADPLYKKERQFYYKVKLIKENYGSSINEVSLIAAVLHRYSSNDVAYKANFDSNFDSEEYSSILSKLKTLFFLTDDGSSSDNNDKDQILANEKIDLLTLASIVMVDSNHNGTYSDVCFKQALAGDRLVGNDSNDESYFEKVMNSVLNKLVCERTKANSGNYEGDNDFVASESEKRRIKNINLVCENGYVGGLYPGIKDITDEELKQISKNAEAQNIIDLANYYKRLYGSGVEEGGSCNSDIAGATGDFASWRQFDPKWGNISLGGSSSISKAGCLVTSISMQIARSGTKIGSLPSGFTEFNPGAFVTTLNNNNGFASGGNFAWSGFNSIAPNWGIGDSVALNVSDNKKLADIVSKELSTGFGNENYQKYLVLQIHHKLSPQHWVAVNGVENGVVTIYDPAKDGTTLDENYDSWVVDSYRVMYAKDVSLGQSRSTANNNGCILSASEGDIKIPEDVNNKNNNYYTVTTIDTINWAYGSSQRDIYEKWLASESKYDNGIAVLDGRYLIACTTTFGKVGDKIDFYLDDGTVIPTIMMDEKSQEVVPWDSNPANKWGHDNGKNIIEFEVAYSYYSKYTNPGTNGWFMEWSGKKVDSATNITNGGVSSSKNKGAYCKNGVAYGTFGRGGNVIANLAVRVAPYADPDNTKLFGPHNLFGSEPNPYVNPADLDSKYTDYSKIFCATISSKGNGSNNPNSINCTPRTLFNNPAYASCVQAAGAIIRATVDPDIPVCNPVGQEKYLKNNSKSDSDKWKLVGTVEVGEKFDDKCQPGDYLITTNAWQHGMIYVGHDLVRQKFGSSATGNIFQAGFLAGDHARYPRIDYIEKAQVKFNIYRPTGNGDFTYDFIDVEKVLSEKSTCGPNYYG